MTDTPKPDEQEGTETPGHGSEHPVYFYESAGIAERDGHIPVWLWIVVAALFVWGIYYLVTYWNAPVTSM